MQAEGKKGDMHFLYNRNIAIIILFNQHTFLFEHRFHILIKGNEGIVIPYLRQKNNVIAGLDSLSQTGKRRPHQSFYSVPLDAPTMLFTDRISHFQRAGLMIQHEHGLGSALVALVEQKLKILVSL